MRFQPDAIRSAEVVVVGGGVAGLSVALHARGRDVVILSKTRHADGGSSVHAQGGIAAALGGGDAPSLHASDTISAGAGLCDPSIVHRVTAEGPRRIRELIRLGARFDRNDEGGIALGREAAHSRHRVAHAMGDATGAELTRALGQAVLDVDRIRVDDDVLAIELVLEQDSVAGLAAVDRTGRNILYVASEVVLATGGLGRLWSRSTNPGEVTGDGLAMAVRAGARTADLEFMQFHPTALDVGAARMPLLTEALRGEGAVLIDGSGRRFMETEHPDAELAPRDVVARAIWRRSRDGDRIFLDATRLSDRIEDRFPTVAGLCRDHGFDLATEAIPVSPAAHYHMGGIAVDPTGRSTIPGLWAVGEAARTGLHGANRLASNSLLEALVYGAAAGKSLAADSRAPIHPVRVHEALRRRGLWLARNPWLERAPDEELEIEKELRCLMWNEVGLERSAAGLRRAGLEIEELAARAGAGRGELGNMLESAAMVVRAAGLRTESRGAHFRRDFPLASRCWLQALEAEGRRFLDPHPVAPAAAFA